jgi:hypothetical protein
MNDVNKEPDVRIEFRRRLNEYVKQYQQRRKKEREEKEGTQDKRPFFGRGKYNSRNCFCKMCRKIFVRKKWEHGGFCKDCIDELYDHNFVCGRCNNTYTNGKRGLCCVCIDSLMKMTGKVHYEKYQKYRVDPYEKWIQTDECPRCYVCKDVIKIDKYNQIPGPTCNYRDCRLEFHKHCLLTIKECLTDIGVSKDMQNYICKFIET